MKRPADKFEGLLAIAAIVLAWRGKDPNAIAARAGSAAQAFATARQRLEDFAMQQTRAAMGCRAPAPCACGVCGDRTSKGQPS